jgi:hypothetical protein
VAHLLKTESLPPRKRVLLAASLGLGAAALIAAALPGLAHAQVTGTRLPPNVTVVEGLTVNGAINDGSRAEQGEDPADLAMADIPAVYEDDAQAAPAPAPQAPVAPEQPK